MEELHENRSSPYHCRHRASRRRLGRLAAGMSKSSASKPATTGSASSMSQHVAKDSLSLSASQQQTAWKDISAQATRRIGATSFTAKVGAGGAEQPRHAPGTGQHREQGA